MIGLFGVLVSDADARTLVDLLLRNGEFDGLTAADAIEHGLRTGDSIIGLDPAEGDAIANVLDDPPDGLTSLRNALIR